MRLASLIFALVIISAVIIYYSDLMPSTDSTSDQTIIEQKKQLLDEAKQATEEMQKALEEHQQRFDSLDEK